ncbi:MAG: hypothetical protein MUF34_23800 [Polyangiaceae bacterium]|jgi:hypothetical protein|nr:hypothetical protein [Polyangiaceae bacterium]
MRTDERIEADFRALAEATRRDLPSAAQTARALASAGDRRRPKRPAYATALGVALAGTALLVPLPYSRSVGYELEVRGEGGRITHLRMPQSSEAQAKRRAELVGRRAGAAVSVKPLTERVWGSVYAMAQEAVLQLRVDLEGKTDEQIAADLDAQLRAGGYEPSAIEVERQGDEAKVGFEAEDGEGRHVKLMRRSKGGGPVEIELGGIDDKREPGMSDEQLREKIVRQFKARGFDAEVTVEGDQVKVRVQKGPPPP